MQKWEAVCSAHSEGIGEKAICYIIVASVGTSHYKSTKKLLQVYKKGESDAFKSRACG